METITAFGSQLSLPSRTNLFPTSILGKPAKQVRLKASLPTFPPLHVDAEATNIRNFKKLPPSQWTHFFHSVNDDVSEMSAVEKEIEMLKLNVKEVLMSESQTMDGEKKKVLLIYLLVSLGLAYQFEDEINENLLQSFKKIEDMLAGENDLYTVSILFWVFRTYGHNMSSDVFKRFQGDVGKFKECLVEDPKGILSLYEAANLRTTTDYILDEALSFTSIHLESLVAGGTCPPHLATRIRNALALSQHWNMEILVALEHIPFYEQEVDHDEMLLKFSKLNLKLLQLHYRQELKIVTKWYKDHDFASNLQPFYRDRIVELHFFVLAMYFEPKFSSARIMLTKFFKVLTILDDTCDRYASLPEAKSLVNSLERWASDDVMGRQPEFLKFVFNFILNAFEEFERELRPEGRSYDVEATIEEFKTLVKANLDFTKWALAGHVPSFEDYMEVGEVEVTVYVTLAGTLMVMGHIASKEAHEWLKSRPKITQILSTKGRLRNDMAGFEDDMSRGNFTTGVNCYMNQYGVTEKKAYMELHKMVAEADKTLNEEMLKKCEVPRQVLKTVINLARMINVTYNVNEGYTFPEVKIYEYITSLFVDEIHV